MSVSSLITINALRLGVLLTALGMMLFLLGDAGILTWREELDMLIDAGILLLILAPLLGAVALMASFLREGDRRHAGISLIVVLLVLAALAHGVL